MKLAEIFNGCAGTNTVNDPVSIRDSELAYAVNVEASENGKILSRVDGYSEIITASSGHSLYGIGSKALYMDGGSLCSINEGNGKAIIEIGYSGERVSFARYGSLTYFSNRNEHGIVYDDAVTTWDVDEYNGPDSSDIHYESEVPKFDLIAVHGSYLLGAYGNALFSCDLPGMFGTWDLERVILFDTDIQMIAPVDGGVFISDGQETWFLRGTNCKDFVQGEPVANYPAFPWSLAQNKFEGLEVGLQQAGMFSIWNTPEGLCAGGPNGAFVNLIKGKIIYPDISGYGATLLRDYRVISTVADSFTTDTHLKIGEIGGKATFQRTNFNFNSYCRRGNDFLACADDGIYLLGGNTFDGSNITSTFDTKTIDTGGSSFVQYLYFGVNTEDGLTITPYREETAIAALTLSPVRDGLQHVRVKCSIGARGSFWKWRVQNIDGGQFHINRMQGLIGYHTKALKFK